MYHYKNVSAATVKPELRVMAERSTTLAASELQLEPITIQWYQAVSSAGESDWSAERDEYGHSEALSLNQVWLNVDQSPQQATLTAAHEVKHLAQYRDGSLPKYELLITKDMRRNAEFHAERFGQAIACRLVKGNSATSGEYLTRGYDPLDEGAVLLFEEATRLLKSL